MSTGQALFWGAIVLAVVIDLALVYRARRYQKQYAAGQAEKRQDVAGPISLARSWLQDGRPWRLRVSEWFGAARQGLGRQGRYWWGLWLTEVWANGRHLAQLGLAVAVIAINLSISFVYARATMVQGWQLWTWAFGVLAVCYFLLPASGVRLPGLRFWLPVAGLGLAAFALRAAFLETVPGGLHGDESVLARFALDYIYPDRNHTLNPFSTATYSQPALFHYLVRLSLAVAGETIAGLRLPSALAGAGAVAATFLAVSVLQDRRTAWLTAILMAGYHFHIHWSRIALNNVWDTLWVPLILGAFLWGWQRQWSGGAVLAGLFLGLSQYFYSGSRLAVFLLAFLVIRLWRVEAERPKLVVHLGKLLFTAGCVAAPLFMFAARNPEIFFGRAREVFGWTPTEMAATVGDQFAWGNFLLYQVGASLGAFTTVPDVTGFYGPNVPLLFGLAAPLFLVGAALTLARRQYLPVLWVLLTALLGGVLLAGAPSSGHYVVAIPAICWLVATPVDWLMQTERRKLALLIVVLIIASDLAFYFGVYTAGPPRDLNMPFPSLPG